VAIEADVQFNLDTVEVPPVLKLAAKFPWAAWVLSYVPVAPLPMVTASHAFALPASVVLMVWPLVPSSKSADRGG
jgi:hypothetical protein